jgi:hypothetical protein
LFSSTEGKSTRSSSSSSSSSSFSSSSSSSSSPSSSPSSSSSSSSSSSASSSSSSSSASSSASASSSSASSSSGSASTSSSLDQDVAPFEELPTGPDGLPHFGIFPNATFLSLDAVKSAAEQFAVVRGFKFIKNGGRHYTRKPTSDRQPDTSDKQEKPINSLSFKCECSGTFKPKQPAARAPVPQALSEVPDLGGMMFVGRAALGLYLFTYWT